MSNFKVVIEWEFEETGSYPVMKAKALCSATTVEGNTFVKEITQDCNDMEDGVKTMHRSSHFTDLLKILSLAAIPTEYTEYKFQTKEEKEKDQVKSIEKQQEEFYNNLRKKLVKQKYGELRKWCHDQQIDVSIKNGAPKNEVANKIIAAIKKKEANEKNN
jgi:hypothetical protein|tara:strand:+ start:1510 stop:1989 length:480 start_codon:yes stop_codon:yes gene_type:complete